MSRREAEVGKKLPAALRAAWRFANGGKAYSPVFAWPGQLTGCDFVSFHQALSLRKSMQKRAPQYDGYHEPRRRDARIKSGWFQPGWLPFADFGGGAITMMVDMSPSNRGSRGQVIAFVHDPDQISYVAPSFDQLLTASLKALRDDAGEYSCA